MSVKERLKKFIKTKNMTISEFEKSILVANGYVNSISKSIGIEKINKILEIYPNLNISWLITGEGPMEKEMVNLWEQHNQENVAREHEVQLIRDCKQCKIYEEMIEDKNEMIKLLKEKIKRLEDDKG